MTCASCVVTLTQELENLEFVESVDVGLMTHNAKVVFRASKDNSDRMSSTTEMYPFFSAQDSSREYPWRLD
jgi:copper chaperone CopZ